ncbi:MAG: TolC family protein, partial [Pyrinomonadaceae bacterium]
MNLRYVIAGMFASVVLAAVPSVAFAQHPAASTALSYTKYLNERDGRTVDDLVKAALANNLEVMAMRKEAEAGEALIRQARLRANPSLEVSGTRQIGGMGDNSVMVQGALPLELGGRRAARISVAEKELEIRRQALAELERQLAADVRAKFGEALAAIFKLKFTEDILVTAEQNVQLV